MLCLLLAMTLFSRLSAAGSCETGIQALNTSGNLNRTLSVDPIGKNEGFAAVLYNNRNGLPTSEANAIAQTDDGFLWIGSYAGLIRYDGSSFVRIGATDGIANVRCLYVDSRNRLWIGTNDAGIFLMVRDELRHWGKSDGLSSLCVRSVAEDEKGALYFGTADGEIAVIDGELKLSVIKDERLAGQTVLGIRPAGDGLIYGNTSAEDLFALKDGKLAMVLSHDISSIDGLLCILPDPERPGYLYVGTSYSRIFHGRPDEGFTELRENDASPLGRISVLEYIEGKIWIGAANGIGVLDAEGVHPLENIPMDNVIEHVLTDFEGNLWFTSGRHGLMKIVPTRFVNLFERYDLPAAVVKTSCMYGDQLFIGTDSGLIVLEGEKKLDGIPLTKAATASGAELEADDLLDFLEGVNIRSIIRASREK